MGFTEGRGLTARTTDISWPSAVARPNRFCTSRLPRVQDVLWLLVLGLALRAPAVPRDVLRAAQSFAPDFAPCTDVVAAVVKEAEASGVIDRDDGLLVLTDHGRCCLVRLMTAALPTLRGGLGRTEARVRLGLLDLLAEDVRAEALDRLCDAARADMAEAVHRLEAPWAGHFGRFWEAGDLTDAAAALDRLRQMRTQGEA